MKSLAKKLIASLLTVEARLVLFRYRPKIVAITGSVGKTATKDAVYTVLKEIMSVRKSAKSFNSELGIPLTILGVEESGWGSASRWFSILCGGLIKILYAPGYPEWLVLEAGVDRPYDMARLTRWLSPDCVVITRFADVPVHLEFFPSRTALIEEKLLLAQSVRKNGFLVLNRDDTDLAQFVPPTGVRVRTYGKHPEASLCISDARIVYDKENAVPKGVSFVLASRGESHTLMLRGTLGLHFAYALAAACAVGQELGVSLSHAVSALADFPLPRGRMRLLEGVQGSIVIDDTYNASPVALHAALLALRELSVRGRKIVLLGDMRELGAEEKRAHEQAGEDVAEVADYLFTVGTSSLGTHEAARRKEMSSERLRHFDSSEKAGLFLKEFLRDGDAVLVKGSQGMRMEKAVAIILAHPEKKNELLVRQEKEWEKKI